MKQKQTYLFLYLKTGGGHLAPARSVANCITAKHPHKIEPKLVDGFTGVNKIVKYIVEDGYRKSQATAVWVFETLYALNKIPFLANFSTFLISLFVKPSLEKQILTDKPAKIVIFHFFLIRPVVEILRRHNLKTPVVTLVTDPFTAHPIWFFQKPGKYIVFSQKLKDHCIKKGIPEKEISVFPFILDEKFTRPLAPVMAASIKQNLGYLPEKRIILILGGGDGIPKGKKILKRLMQNHPDTYIAIVCGNNKELYKKAWKLKSKYDYENLRIYGYVEFIYELINISDVVITKCGASTFMEILLSGKVPIISNYIWEQEKGNMEFVRDNFLGVYEKDIDRLPQKTLEIIRNQEIYDFYKSNIDRIGLKNGTPMVSKYLISQ
jgi:UDP-N-acetylglucosamine:LPS N-acetylglucosamine transferase